MKAGKIVICLLLTACCTFLDSSLVIHASNTTEDIDEVWPAGPEVTGESAIVMEVNSGTVLYTKNCHEELYPASTTKILTGLLAIENSQMDEQVTFSYDSVHKTEGSSIWRDVDEVMTMEQCLYGLLLNSANECGYAIAEHVGGTYDAFVQMMNDRAQALGCQNTHFANPHGLTDEQHYTSCYDMALIASDAIKNETFRKITGTVRYNIPPTNKHPDETTYLRNHHKMLLQGEEFYYEYCIGGKTGYTEAAGNTLVTYAEKDGMLLVCVVMKEKPTEQYQDTRALLNYCFENFRIFNIEENLKGNQQEIQDKDGFLTSSAFAEIEKEAAIVLPVNAVFSDAAAEVLYNNKDKDTVGTLQFTYAGQVVGAADVVRAEASVKEFPFGKPPVKQAGQENGDSQEEKKVVKVNVLAIVLPILGVVAVAAAVFGIYQLIRNFHLLRYKFRSRRGHNMRTIVIDKKRRRRRRR